MLHIFVLTFCKLVLCQADFPNASNFTHHLLLLLFFFQIFSLSLFPILSPFPSRIASHRPKAHVTQFRNRSKYNLAPVVMKRNDHLRQLLLRTFVQRIAW